MSLNSYTCSDCRKRVDPRTIVGNNIAWCSHCKKEVEMSCFEIQGWILGVVLVLAAQVPLI